MPRKKASLDLHHAGADRKLACCLLVTFIVSAAVRQCGGLCGKQVDDQEFISCSCELHKDVPLEH